MRNQLANKFLNCALNVAISTSLVIYIINSANASDLLGVVFFKILLASVVCGWSWFICKSFYDYLGRLEDGKNEQ